MTPKLLAEIAAEANLAPSVHNTQPVKWQMSTSTDITLTLDPTRRLEIGDPHGQDARLSGGAALLGAKYALMRKGFAARGTEVHGDQVRIALGAEPAETPPPLELLERRTSYRGGFAPTGTSQRAALEARVRNRSDTVLLSEAHDMAQLSELNDIASLTVMRGHAFRAELCHGCAYRRATRIGTGMVCPPKPWPWAAWKPSAQVFFYRDLVSRL